MSFKQKIEFFDEMKYIWKLSQGMCQDLWSNFIVSTILGILCFM